MTEQKAAIVTGAGSGIGRATATLLAERGYAVVLVARTQSDLEETVEQMGAHRETLILPIDLAQPQAAMQIVDAAVERFGRIDALVNNAGYAKLSTVDQNTPEHVRTNLAVNLEAPILLTAAVWPIFRGRQSGVIVNITSLASIDPFPQLSAYAAAKGGLNLFTLCTAREGADIGVRAVSIALGAVETPMLRGLFDESQLSPEKALPPAEVAELIVGCVAGERTFEPGEVIRFTVEHRT